MDLFILLDSDNWILVDFLDHRKREKYIMSYKFISYVLNKYKNIGNNVELDHKDKSYSDINYKITTNIIKIESHRHCTVVFCRQYDYLTNGLRFIVYGIKHETDYGIGIGLTSINKEWANKICPSSITAKFI